MKTIQLSSEEIIQFQAFKVEQAHKSLEKRQQQEREEYKKLVDCHIEEAFRSLMQTSTLLKKVKKEVLETFSTAIELKGELFNIKEEQRSHTFTNSQGNKRVMVGQYTLDQYRDTVNEGIAIVKETVASLAKDEESKALVNAILKLLSKDQKGNLKPSRILQLRKMAEELKHKRLLEGVMLIEESYQPTTSKVFIRAEYKNQNGAWISVPLGLTEA